MQSSNAPNKIQLPFAASGTKNTIPVPSQQGVTPGAASFTDGFPPTTFTPLSAGGVPPAGADFNGILNSITALQQWKSAGGQFPFDVTFATAIGGYPKGATVLKADGTGLWISTAENNTANPDTGGAGWLAFSVSSVQSGSYNSGNDVGIVNALGVVLNPQPAALHPGMIVIVYGIAATNTGAATLTVNGLGTYPINGPVGLALTGGEITIGSTMQFIVAANGASFNIVSQFVGSMPFAAISALTSNYGPIICSDHGGAIFTFAGGSYSQTTPNNQGGGWSSFNAMPWVINTPIVAHNIGSDSWWLEFSTGLALAGFYRSWTAGTWTLDGSGYYSTTITTALPLTFTAPPYAISSNVGNQISGFVSSFGVAVTTNTQVTLNFQAIKNTTTNLSAQSLFIGTWK
jgi:hypothetical protein